MERKEMVKMWEPRHYKAKLEAKCENNWSKCTYVPLVSFVVIVELSLLRERVQFKEWL